MGESFWVGCGWFFFGVLGQDGDGQGKTPGHVYQSRFHWTTRVFKQTSFYVIYYILSSGGFSTPCFKTITNGVPESRHPGQTRGCRGFDNLVTFFHTSMTMWGLLNFVPPRTPRNSWYDGFYRCGLRCMLFMLYVIYCVFVYVYHTTVKWWWEL